MGRVVVGQENSGPIELHCEDHGHGRPVVLIHGWPLSAHAWDKQVSALLDAGFRVVAYDRRGFGRSSRPASGYEYDTLSDDLHAVMTALDLRDAALVGFSMGGGEVARYLSRHGTERVRAAAFLGAIPPFLRRSADNPSGVEASVFESIKRALASDRPAFLSGFLRNFYNADVLGGTRISEQAMQADWNVAVGASLRGAIACVDAWGTDFRADLARCTVPTLVVHGDSDRIVPLEISGRRTHELVRGSRLSVIAGGPHGFPWTHADELNSELAAFLR